LENKATMAALKTKTSARRHHPYIKQEKIESHCVRTPSPVSSTQDVFYTPQTKALSQVLKFTSTPINPSEVFRRHFIDSSPITTGIKCRDVTSPDQDSGYQSPGVNNIPEDNISRRGHTMFTNSQLTSLEEEYTRDPYLTRP
jgi:hypothetical protein